MTSETKIPAKTKEVFEYLKACAAQMRTVNYGEIAESVGLPAIGLAYPLGYIRDHICRERGLPWLNALAVNKDTWRPGDNFLPTGVARGRDEERFWRGMVVQVFIYDWEVVTFYSRAVGED
jgi:hypothetical protein